METSKKVNSLRLNLGAMFTSVFRRETMLVFEKMLADTGVKIKTKARARQEGAYKRRHKFEDEISTTTTIELL